MQHSYSSPSSRDGNGSIDLRRLSDVAYVYTRSHERPMLLLSYSQSCRTFSKQQPGSSCELRELSDDPHVSIRRSFSQMRTLSICYQCRYEWQYEGSGTSSQTQFNDALHFGSHASYTEPNCCRREPNVCGRKWKTGEQCSCWRHHGKEISQPESFMCIYLQGGKKTPSLFIHGSNIYIDMEFGFVYLVRYDHDFHLFISTVNFVIGRCIVCDKLWVYLRIRSEEDILLVLLCEYIHEHDTRVQLYLYYKRVVFFFFLFFAANSFVSFPLLTFVGIGRASNRTLYV